MSLFLIAIFYQLLQLLALPFLFVYLIYKEIRYSPVIGDLTQRLGFIPKTNALNHQVIWLHAVSVGEVLSIEILIKQIKKEHPDAIIYVTTGTTAGKKIAQQQLTTDMLSLMPYDFLPSILLAFKRIAPTSIILVEAEIWPNFLLLAHYKNIPVYLLNARMNRSYKLYKLCSFFFTPILTIFKHIFAQSELDKKKFNTLGILEKNITILGNIKTFNVYYKQQEYLEKHNSEKLNQQKKEIPGITLLVGSLHPGELSYYLKLFCSLKEDYKNLTIILVPRHFHWKKTLEQECKNTKYRVITLEQHSAQKIPNILKKQEADIILVCELNELFKLHAYADIFYLGGTFVPVGGHNLLEPAIWANPIIIGPWHHNCHPISEELETNNALIKVLNETELLKKTEELIAHAPIRKTMGSLVLTWILKEKKATKQTIYNLIKNL